MKIWNTENMGQMGLLSDPLWDRELAWVAKAQLSGRTEAETQFLLPTILLSENIKSIISIKHKEVKRADSPRQQQKKGQKRLSTGREWLARSTATSCPEDVHSQCESTGRSAYWASGLKSGASAAASHWGKRGLRTERDTLGSCFILQERGRKEKGYKLKTFKIYLGT